MLLQKVFNGPALLPIYSSRVDRSLSVPGFPPVTINILIVGLAALALLLTSLKTLIVIILLLLITCLQSNYSFRPIAILRASYKFSLLIPSAFQHKIKSLKKTIVKAECIYHRLRARYSSRDLQTWGQCNEYNCYKYI